MSDVFVVGALHLDVVVDAPRLPLLDETLFGTGVAYRFGGKGGNQALAAARMGAEVAMAGRVGSDGFAEKVLSDLDAGGVDRAQVRQVPGATGMSVAIVEAGGEYAAVVVSGVNQSIDAQDFDAQDAEVVLLQNEIPEAVNVSVVQNKQHGTQVVLNAAPAREVSSELMQGIDVLVVNRVEAAQMTGTNPHALDVERAARSLAARGPRSVVVTAGSDGAVVHDGTTQEWVRPPARSSGSAHGAGDAFVGALGAEIARGRSLMDAVRFASGAAAFFVKTHPDARMGITRSDVDAWIAAQ